LSLDFRDRDKRKKKEKRKKEKLAKEEIKVACITNGWMMITPPV
jgi:hypothetical protein